MIISSCADRVSNFLPREYRQLSHSAFNKIASYIPLQKEKSLVMKMFDVLKGSTTLSEVILLIYLMSTYFIVRTLQNTGNKLLTGWSGGPVFHISKCCVKHFLKQL